jgi:predicted RNase H-like HicB family nuclease
MRIHDVFAEWDDEARVWVATSDDIPGLVTEAETKEQLVARLRAMVPELLSLNAHLVAADDSHEFCIHWKEEQRVSYA